MQTNSWVVPPPALHLPIIRHLIGAYKVWHEFLPHVPKDSRYTLGIKIDRSFIATVELLFLASYAKKGQKLPYLERAATQLDLAKFFLQILWEIKGLDDKKYITLSEKLAETGNMLGGWIRQTAKKETPATKE